MIKEFRDFILRGNIIELAVAFVIGAAFTAVVMAFVTYVINPIIAAAGGDDSIGLGVTLISSNPATRIDFGAFIGALTTFLITAAVVFFIFVRPMNARTARLAKPEEPKQPDRPADVILLEEIRDLLRQRA